MDIRTFGFNGHDAVIRHRRGRDTGSRHRHNCSSKQGVHYFPAAIDGIVVDQMTGKPVAGAKSPWNPISTTTEFLISLLR